jgi:predicted secreted protein
MTAARHLPTWTLLLLLAACDAAKTPKTPQAPIAPGTTVLTSADSGRTIETSPGTVFDVRLDASPSKGGRWNIVTAPDMRIAGVAAVETDPPAAAPGAPQFQHWTIEAVAAGTTSLKVAQGAQEFTLTFVVR